MASLAADSLSAGAEQVEGCVFCRIASGKQEATIVFESDELVAFRDIRPAAEHHYLVIPRRHVVNAKHLHASDLQLVEKMLETGKTLLEERNMVGADASFGFHWPPFTMVQHLHLHVIAPASSMGFMNRLIFRANSLWYVTADWLQERLRSMQAPTD